MIVNEKQAKAAWEVMLEHCCRSEGADDWDFPLNDEGVTVAYRYAAKKTHPDAEGGSIEAFASVDRAKHILLNWLRRQADKPPPRIAPEPCNNCDGQGYLSSARGFRKPMRVQCGKCRGTGEAGVEHDLGGE